MNGGSARISRRSPRAGKNGARREISQPRMNAVRMTVASMGMAPGVLRVACCRRAGWDRMRNNHNPTAIGTQSTSAAGHQRCQRPFKVSSKERGQVPRQVGERPERPVGIRHDLLADIRRQLRRGVDHPRQVQQRHNHLCAEPDQQRPQVSPPAPGRIDRQADGQEDGVVLGVQRGGGEEDVGKEATG